MTGPEVLPGWWVGPAPILRPWHVLILAGGSSLSGDYPGTREEAEAAALASFYDGADPVPALVESSPASPPPWEPGAVRYRRHVREGVTL